MAIDVYLQLDGIKGESADSQHAGWIECTMADWMISQPRSATSSTSGGHTAERCEHSSFALRKLTDLATPILLQHCAMGKTIPSGRLEFFRADGLGSRVKYFELELTNVLVSEVAPELQEGTFMSEHVSLKYSKVKWRYIKQKVGGGTAGLTAGGWDLAVNRIC
ncbi:type VI secretion system tube protein Hcp [Massilia sp.]|uniref:Hcp family type VI secretion system effector n=1 Tax=Massilia sp. TaxID=1882437 RepID=UPI0028A287E2|nr:type VI secretion system tube protein Hcp [Massilia sp.]